MGDIMNLISSTPKYFPPPNSFKYGPKVKRQFVTISKELCGNKNTYKKN